MSRYPRLVVDRHEVAPRRHADDVHQHVEPAVERRRPVDDPLRLDALGDVARQRGRLHAEGGDLVADGLGARAYRGRPRRRARRSRRGAGTPRARSRSHLRRRQRDGPRDPADWPWRSPSEPGGAPIGGRPGRAPARRVSATTGPRGNPSPRLGGASGREDWDPCPTSCVPGGSASASASRVVLDDVDLEVPAGRGDRAARAERRRQDDADADPLRRARRPTPARSSGTAAPATDDDRRSWGYMPQERGLYRDMRVLDLLVWIARLHGLDQATGRAPGRATCSSARPRRPRPRQGPGPVGRHGPAGAAGGGDGARARRCSCSTSRSPASTRWPSASSPSVILEHVRGRPQPAVLQPPARPRRGPLRDDHAHPPRPGRARRATCARSRRPAPTATCGSTCPSSRRGSTRRRPTIASVDARRARRLRLAPERRPRRRARRRPGPRPGHATSASRRPACRSCSSPPPAGADGRRRAATPTASRGGRGEQPAGHLAGGRAGAARGRSGARASGSWSRPAARRVDARR